MKGLGLLKTGSSGLGEKSNPIVAIDKTDPYSAKARETFSKTKGGGGEKEGKAGKVRDAVLYQ